MLTLMMWSGAPSPAVCCTAPLMPRATYRDGIDDDAGRADLALVLDPSAIGDHARGAHRRPELPGDASELPEAVLAVEPGTAGHDAVGFGEVHRRHVRGQDVDDDRVVHRRLAGELGDRGRRRLGEQCGDAAHARLQRRHHRSVDGDVDQFEPAGADQADGAGGDLDGVGQQAPAEHAGEPRREVATVR